MISKPEYLPFERMIEYDQDNTVLLVTPSVARKAAELSLPTIQEIDSIPPGVANLLVIGGGTLIDRAKVWRATQAPEVKLIAIPSIWGSGAEVSPIAVLNAEGGKSIHIGEEFQPDVYSTWPELADSIPVDRAREACGDTWSHALEGMLSPLADEALQVFLAGVIVKMLALPLSNDPAWFEASALACLGQSRSSVGLVHGIAHTLESPLVTAFPASRWGHAKLCSVFLLPVMEFNLRQNEKWNTLSRKHGIDQDRVVDVLRELHDPAAYDESMALLEQHWKTILRDPCTRTNSALVRPDSKQFFTSKSFL